MVTRIALYSHDSIGLGHVRRNLALAHALSASLPALTGEAVSGLLITGASDATTFPLPDGWDWLVVPALTRGEQGYESRHLHLAMPALTTMRGNIVRVALRDFAPDLVIVDRHALGVQRELEGALAALRATRPQCAIVLGLREVLDRRSVALSEWKALGGPRAVRELFDAIWVYGDPLIHNALATGEIPAALADLVVHTGYLANGRPPGRSSHGAEPFVLTMLGGGSDGRELATAAVHAAVPAGYQHTIVTGPQMPRAHRSEIRALAGPATTVVRSVPDALALARQASAVVCMGGYNTVNEVMSTTVPALIVPRVHRRQEQAIRARALAAHGLIDSALPSSVTPELLGDWFQANVGRTVHRTGVDLDGLRRVGQLAADLLRASAAASVQSEVRHAV
ncbi:glycosyl transferase family 28 [Cryobacterium frigoriphilum]|uniref:Glycosyl transferase family 28 n=1 Tax=Cryobacterium frigoriphilum TaxID=1259150 RepID=A0A4V3IQX6_9MICO|nr:glycosyl transferase family 28 [Cryobacterium frigoriphilum]